MAESSPVKLQLWFLPRFSAQWFMSTYREVAEETY